MIIHLLNVLVIPILLRSITKTENVSSFVTSRQLVYNYLLILKILIRISEHELKTKIEGFDMRKSIRFSKFNKLWALYFQVYI